MRPSIYKVTDIGQGKLYVMPKPSMDWLRDDLAYLQRLGITKVLSLLEAEEEQELGLKDEGAICASLQMEFASFSIVDRGLPNMSKLKTLVQSLLHEVRSGTALAIHCRGGIGRTGVISCCMLIENGLLPDQALRVVADARGCGIPDTDEQKELIRTYKAN